MRMEMWATAGSGSAAIGFLPQDGKPSAGLPGRRTVLRTLSAAGLFVPLLAAPAIAEGNKTTRGACWVLGDNLSLAALLYAQNASQDLIDQTLGKAKQIAQAIGLEIKPFPPRSDKRGSTSADIIHYLIKGDGAELGSALSRKFDDEHGTLYEVSVKSNLLIILYAPDDSLGKTIADVVKSRCESIHLPPRLWNELVTLVYNRRSQDEVKNAVFKMHKDVANFFLADS
jgi:hypothetical protein